MLESIHHEWLHHSPTSKQQGCWPSCVRFLRHQLRLEVPVFATIATRAGNVDRLSSNSPCTVAVGSHVASAVGGSSTREPLMGAPRSFAHTANAERIERIDISRSTSLHWGVFRATELLVAIMVALVAVTVSLAAITESLAAITKSLATITKSLSAITKFLVAFTKSSATLNTAPSFSVPTSVILPDASVRRAT